MSCRLIQFTASMVLLAVLSSEIGQAAETNESSAWAYRAWQTDEGLPDNSVTGVLQTGDGYLWVATYGGLVRFNGATFAAAQLPGVLKKSVRAMLLDHYGRFWLGMDSGSVICLKSNTSLTFTSGDGLPAERIAAMAEDHDGTIWVIYSTTLCQIKNGQVSRLTVTEGLPAGINGWVTSDARGELWFSRGGQIGVFRDGKLLPKKELAFNETSLRIHGAASSGLWICAGSRLLKYEENHEPEVLARFTNNVEPQVLFEDRRGALWIGTAADGLFRFKGGALVKVPTSHQSVNCLSEDYEGNLWAGTRGGGLNLIRSSAVEVIGRESGLPFESAGSVCQDADGVMWVAAQSGILTKYRDGKWEVVGTEAGWTGDAATCVAADKKGGVWVGSRDRRLHYYHDGTWRIWQRSDGLHNGSVHLIFVTASNDVWVVTGSPSRLHHLRDGKLSEPMLLPGGSHTLRAMAESADGSLWAGTLEGQVLRVKDSSLVVEAAATEANGSPVRALETTPDGALWVGYAGAGIGRLKGGKIARITEANGLLDDFATQLLADGRGGMWVVGNRGVFKLQLDELNAVAENRADRLRSQVFGRNEGLPNFQPNSANFPSDCKAGDGRLWFALHSGLLTVQPERIHLNPVPPPVLMERVTVDDKTTALYDSRSPLRTASGADWTDLRKPDPEVRIQPGHRKVELEFAALSYASPENVQFRYRLAGFDEDWVEANSQTGEKNKAKYPHLTAGNYQFQVRACNNAGVWNEAGATLTLVVSPYFWQTWWFRGMLLALFTMGVVAIVRYVSFRRLRVRMLHLEQQAAVEKERSRIARDMHDEVGAKLTRLSLLTEMAGTNPEMPASAHGEVREISDTARETIRSFEEAVWAVNPRNDTLTDLMHYLCRYAEDYFDGSPVRCVFELPAQIPAVVLAAEVRRQVFLAAKEALNNVLKHARANRVSMRLSTVPDEFRISIEDDGCGFNTDSPPKRSGGGNGLENMRERLRSIGGRLECDSQPGQGTRIVFTAPGNCPTPG